MTPERWRQVKGLLAEALEAEPAARPAFLDRICTGDDALRGDLERMLAADQAAGYLDEASLSAWAQEMFPDDPGTWAGCRVGAYQIVEKIGAGGMAEVHRAFRADDQYQKQVAIKLLQAGPNPGFLVARFKNERQVLASLDHPNIARLLDGGATPEGVPYIVMELIDGRPIDVYCEQQHLSLAARLGLFLEVSSAVQYAHQRLIIHRDLKPANILVTPDGVPKLLDFGIAKIVASTEMPVTATAAALRPFTPEYASPEQIKGEPVTTASDIYSLGVLLYELLTGRPLHRLTAGTPLEISRRVCESEPQPPSVALESANQKALARHLRGDLDNIVLMATRKEPERRYASVERFGEDIERHLKGLPVTARPDTFAYRAGKFLRRHKAGAAAAALAMLSLAAGLGVALREARIARQQAEIARAQKSRAERRFNDVRKLANALLFEVYGSIQNLPGATPARKLIVGRALEYLDSLSKEAGNDASLASELGFAYHHLAQVQGDTEQGNLGDTREMIESMHKAAALWESAAKANPSGAIDQLNAAFGHRLLAALADNDVEGRREITRAMEISGRLLSIDGANPKIRSERALEYGVLAGAQESSGDLSAALESQEAAAALRETLVKAGYPHAPAGLAITRVQIGELLGKLGQRKSALESNRAGIAIFEDVARNPAEGRARRELAAAWVRRAGLLSMDADWTRAPDASRRALAIVESMARDDPQNDRLRLDIVEYRLVSSVVLIHQGRYTQASPALDQSIAFLEKRQAVASASSENEVPLMLASGYLWRGESFAGTGDPRAALDRYRKAVTVLETASAANADSGMRCELAAVYSKLGAALAASGQAPDALNAFRKSLDLMEPLVRQHPDEAPARYVLADAYFGLGELSTRQASWQEARSWFAQSLDTWRRIANPGPVSPLGFACRNPAAMRRQIARCDRMLPRSHR
jgi:eukaryotic-like serine/threonine-protein kinase